MARLEFVKGQAHIRALNGEQRAVKGLIQCRILPPRVPLPFLPVRIKYKEYEKVLYPICYTCAHKQNHERCTHGEFARSICGDYTLDEIAFALTLGYKMLQVYEAWVYTGFDYVFKDFLKLIAAQKLQNSQLPPYASEDEKESHIQQINKEMGFEDDPDCALRSDNVEHRPALRYLAKIMMNSLLGKVSQNP